MSSLNNEEPVQQGRGGKTGTGGAHRHEDQSPWLWVPAAPHGPKEPGRPWMHSPLWLWDRAPVQGVRWKGLRNSTVFNVTILTLCPLECGTLDQTWFPALHYDSGGKREHLLSLGPLQGREETRMPPSCPQKKLPFHLKTRQPPYQCLCQQNLGAVWGVSNNSTGVLEIWVH